MFPKRPGRRRKKNAIAPESGTDKHSVASPRAPAELRGRRYLTFRVARQDFAMDASRVLGVLPRHELIAAEATDPRLPGWLCGIARMRGRDFPVIDLRGKLGLVHGSHGRTPCIVAVEIAASEGPQLVGFIADRVSEVVKVREHDIRRGKLQIGGRPRQILDPDLVLGREPAPLAFPKD